MTVSLKEGISWVGHVDWGIRDFHGYRSEKGSTYNSYLVLDDQPALIDSVKAPYVNSLLSAVAEAIDPAKIKYVVCNHAEPDHSGGLVKVMERLTGAELVCNAKCRETLGRHYDTSAWRFRVVKDGDKLSLGRRTLQFLDTPMVHWPESMFTYVEQDKLLFSMDAFGQHYAASGRFDDEVPFDTLMAEAKTYYANIVMPYGRQVSAVLDRAGTLEIDMIAPSHGLIWRKNIPAIIEAYRAWAVCRSAAKVLIVFDTMWGSTEKMARAMADGAAETKVDVRLIPVRASHITQIATEIIDAAVVAIGSPTLNGGMMPEISAALTYIKGLRPQNKAGLAFGSYGWGRGGPEEVHGILQAMQFELLREPLRSRYVPDAAVLEECRAVGRQMGEQARQRAGK